jgi:uncharacterized protein RhaS with RHS repeats
MYLSQDPIKLNGGIELYNYVKNPNGWLDIFGLISIPKNVQEHHVISDKNPLTKNHPLINASGFDLQSSSNKILLPTDNSGTNNRTIHKGRHRQIYSIQMASKMDAILMEGRKKGWNKQQYAAAMNDLVKKTKKDLKSGKIALNKNKRSGSCFNF